LGPEHLAADVMRTIMTQEEIVAIMAGVAQAPTMA
jgi:hypothetical protein